MKMSLSSLIPLRPVHVRAALIAAPAFFFFSIASAQSIFVANWGNGTNGAGSINTFNLNGSVATTGLITGLTQPSQIEISGNDLYVVSVSGNSVGKYDLTGAGGNLLTGLTSPTSLAVSGGNLFVSSANGTISRYNTAGTFLDSFSTGFTYISSITVGGSSLYVAGTKFDGMSNAGQLSSFSTSGGSEVSILDHVVGVQGLSFSGSTLSYLTQPAGYSVWSFDGSSHVSHASGINGAIDTTFYGDTIYFTYLNGNTVDGRLGSYSAADGLNLSLVSGLNEPYSVAIGGSAIPEPSTYAAMAGAAALGLAMWRRRQQKNGARVTMV
ncbi:PEP-CTERM sorting domain-containing protein [Oleiharenicola lentus]|uniref:PEP-CTERM sorting domain-containing protein n=1 Tax=Oleiharenicola lentus TaxID=2508720 RepID=UPI003F669971